MEYTFEQLPKAVTLLHERLENIEQLLVGREVQKDEVQLLTIKEAAQFLNLTVPTLYGYSQRNEIPVCRKGKRLYFSKSELIDWVNSGRKDGMVKPTDDIILPKRKGTKA